MPPPGGVGVHVTLDFPDGDPAAGGVREDRSAHPGYLDPASRRCRSRTSPWRESTSRAPPEGGQVDLRALRHLDRDQQFALEAPVAEPVLALSLAHDTDLAGALLEAEIDLVPSRSSLLEVMTTRQLGAGATGHGDAASARCPRAVARRGRDRSSSRSGSRKEREPREGPRRERIRPNARSARRDDIPLPPGPEAVTTGMPPRPLRSVWNNG